MRILFVLFLCVTCIPIANAHGLFIFPNEDQDQDQQDLDEIQCIRIATDRTGFDPMATPTATRDRPETRGSTAGGAAAGALLGAAVGRTRGSNRVARGARRGAVAGGIMGSMQRADSYRQQEDWAREQGAIYQNDRNQWTRAFSACMESRGYTVG